MKLALVLLVLLAGCAPLQPLERPEPQIIRLPGEPVFIPKPVPCFTEAERPKPRPPTPIDLVHATPAQVAAAQAADLQNADDFAAEVDALFMKCTKGST